MKVFAFEILSLLHLQNIFRDAYEEIIYLYHNFLGFNLPTLGVLFVMLIVGLTIYDFIRTHKRRKARRETLAAFAGQNGWTFAKSGSVGNFPNRVSYGILAYAGDINGMLTRPFDDGMVYLFDYTYKVRRGNSRIHYTQTVVGFSTPHLNVPFFGLAEETTGTWLGKVFGYRDINFDSHPKFSAKYNLSGKDEAAIRQTFQPRILSFLEALPNVQIDAGGNQMFVYNHSRQIAVGDLNAYCEMAVEVYKLFRR